MTEGGSNSVETSKSNDPRGFEVLVHHRPGCASRQEAQSIVETLYRAMVQLQVPAEAELALVLSNDAELCELNERYRGKPGPTDVLSFPVDEAELPEAFARMLGDVIISVAYAERSAVKAGRSRLDELRLLAVHGLLHLLGHEDESEAGAEAMRVLEMELGVRESGD